MIGARHTFTSAHFYYLESANRTFDFLRDVTSEEKFITYIFLKINIGKYSVGFVYKDIENLNLINLFFDWNITGLESYFIII